MVTAYTLQQRIERAHALRAEGYNCSQCVLMVFDDLTQIDASTAARVTGALGGGVAAMGEVCGAVTAMAVADGLLQFASPADKAMVYAQTRGLSEEFVKHNGSMICRELKTKYRRPCIELIDDAITILHNRYA